MAAIPKVPCPQATCLLDAGLQARVLVPDDAEYSARQDSYWSNSAKIKPACIILPHSAQEVSAAIKALVGAGEQFATRSGGHTNWAGSNNIEGGVTIDLSLLSNVSFDESVEIASIGPGARWRDVYAELHKYGRVVAGGREGNVGVAGLLLGGGNTFFTARKGFACDNVVAYEVALADGRIVTADAETHADLFRALKGGSNNFGIVTNFKMSTIKCDRVWGGMTLYPKQNIPLVIDALSTFTNNVKSDIDSNIICMFTYLPDFKDIVIASMFAQVGGVEKAPAYEKWLAIPEITNSVKMTSISEMAFEYNIPAQYYDAWFTMCFKNDTRIMAKAAELHDQLVEELKSAIPDGDFITQCVFQPLPKIFAQQSVAAGGNVMGVEHHAHDGILFLAVAMTKTAEQESFAYRKVKAWIAAVKEYASSIEGGNLEWTYLNYADKSQDPLASYGAENIKKIREAAAKYDPEQVFQKLCPGGYKISHVKA